MRLFPWSGAPTARGPAAEEPPQPAEVGVCRRPGRGRVCLSGRRPHGSSDCLTPSHLGVTAKLTPRSPLVLWKDSGQVTPPPANPAPTNSTGRAWCLLWALQRNLGVGPCQAQLPLRTHRQPLLPGGVTVRCCLCGQSLQRARPTRRHQRSLGCWQQRKHFLWMLQALSGDSLPCLELR